MSRISFDIGDIVWQGNQSFIITRIVDLDEVIGRNQTDGEYKKLKVTTLSNASKNKRTTGERDILSYSDKEWKKAKKRLEIIRPLIEDSGNGVLVNQIAKENNIHPATIYRWIERYRTYGKITGLVDRKGKGMPGIYKLDKESEVILKSVIEEEYLSKKTKSIQTVIDEVHRKCKHAKVKPPHANTIRNRIKSISEYEKISSRIGKKKADEVLGEKPGTFPGGNYPLETVQIDHTKLDILLVDDKNREIIGRPWITVAIDIFSRMVLGFFVSFDPPGSMGTGLCLALSVLPKEKWLSQFNLKTSWPCWGIMKTIHCDNANEFTGKTLQKACETYGINLEFRPVARPNYGGHIERLLGTTLVKIHDLPGSTMSNVIDRKDRKPEKNATFTLDELERWLLIFFTKVYHKKIHSSLNMSPEQKYREGILGADNHPGIGIPDRIEDEFKLKLDFMPYYERTVRNDGVQIDFIRYYDNVLRPYIQQKELTGGKYARKRKFIFRRDPRNLKFIYFWNPDLNEYQTIPYADITQPNISIWEFRAALKRVKEKGKAEVNESEIFMALSELKEIESNAIKAKKEAKKAARKASSHQIKKSTDTPTKKMEEDAFDSIPDIDFDDIEPYDILENNESNE